MDLTWKQLFWLSLCSTLAYVFGFAAAGQDGVVIWCVTLVGAFGHGCATAYCFKKMIKE